MNAFYTSNGRRIPEITPLTPRAIPQPYHKLLVHDRNMTSTLEAFHAGPVYIDPLNMVQDEEETSREVILRRQSDDRAVEYGASWVFHRHLPAEASKLIREAKVPLGTVLKLCDCLHSVEALRYFKMRLLLRHLWRVRLLGPLRTTTPAGGPQRARDCRGV